MKILLLSLMMTIFVIASFAQTKVANGSFENWTNRILDQVPTGYWSSGSYNMFQDFPPSVIKDSAHVHSGKYAVTIMTVSAGNDTTNGVIVYTSIPPNKGPDTVWGGFPYSIIPDSITGYCMFHCANKDSAFIAVMLKKNGIRLTFDIFNLYGDQSSFKRFAYKLSNPGTKPDTIIVAFGSSDDMHGNQHLNSGNFITFDDISFTGTSKPMPVIPNSGFENWITTSYEDPANWNSFDIFKVINKLPLYVTKYSPAYSGNFAVSIKTSRFDQQTIDSTGFLTTGDLFGGMTGGFKMDTNYVPDSIGFYYRYFNSHSLQDSAVIWINFTKYNSLFHHSDVVQSVLYTLSATASYKFKSVRFNFSGKNTDTCNITFGSSNFTRRNLAGIGNELVVDYINFYYKGLGIPSYQLIGNNGRIYPNPGTDEVNIDFVLPVKNQVSIYLTDFSGKVIQSRNVDAQEGLNHLKLNVRDLSSGTYIYSIITPDSKFSGKLEIKR